MGHLVLWTALLALALSGCAGRPAPVAVQGPRDAREMAPVAAVEPDAMAAQPGAEVAGEIDRQLALIRDSLERIGDALRRLSAVGGDDPAAPELRRAMHEGRQAIGEARSRLAELEHPLGAVEIDFEDVRAPPGDEPGLRGLPALVLRNVGDGLLHIRSLAVVGDRPADHVVLVDGCSGTTLAPGERCVIEPRFDPAELRLHWADLELNHDGQPGTHTVPLPGGAMAAMAMRDGEPLEMMVPDEEPILPTLSPDSFATAVPMPPPSAVSADDDSRDAPGDAEGDSDSGSEMPPSLEDDPIALPPDSSDSGPDEPGDGDAALVPPDPGSGPGPPPPVESSAADRTTTIVFAALGAALLAMIVGAAVVVASPSPFQLKVFNTALAAGAALVVTGVVRAAGLPERAVEAAGTRLAGFAAQGAVGLLTFFTVFLGQPLQRLGLGGAAAAAPVPPPAAPVEAPPRSIFISYRRSDSADITGRIHEHLVRRYGDRAVFKDVEDITLGLDFRKVLAKALAECRVVLAVIGPKWASQTEDGARRRLDDPADTLRLEVESALSRNLPLVPLLVHGASIPAADELPASLEGLAFRNGMPVRPDPDFANDMRRLIADVDRILAGGSGLWGQEGPEGGR